MCDWINAIPRFSQDIIAHLYLRNFGVWMRYCCLVYTSKIHGMIATAGIFMSWFCLIDHSLHGKVNNNKNYSIIRAQARIYFLYTIVRTPRIEFSNHFNFIRIWCSWLLHWVLDMFVITSGLVLWLLFIENSDFIFKEIYLHYT